MLQSTEIKIYCINRVKDVERKKFMLDQLQYLPYPFEFFEATEGELLDPFDPEIGYNSKTRKFFFTSDMKMSEIACFSSHKRVLEKFLHEDFPYCIVLEDDALILDDFTNTLLRLIQLPQKCWDVIKLEKRSDRGCKITCQSIDLIIPYNYGGTTALLFNKKGAAKVYSSLSTFFQPIDIHLGYLHSKGIKLFTLAQPIVKEDSDRLPTTIGKRDFTDRKWTFTIYRIYDSLLKRLRCLFFTTFSHRHHKHKRQVGLKLPSIHSESTAES